MKTVTSKDNVQRLSEENVLGTRLKENVMDRMLENEHVIEKILNKECIKNECSRCVNENHQILCNVINIEEW